MTSIAPRFESANFQILPLRTDEHVVLLRKAVREQLIATKFSLMEQTKCVTAASELARNTLKYGGGGEVRLSIVESSNAQGVCLVFIDSGPGIPDVDQALTDGFTTQGGLGLGLGGAKRLMDEFQIESEPGKGTTVRIVKWKK